MGKSKNCAECKDLVKSRNRMLGKTPLERMYGDNDAAFRAAEAERDRLKRETGIDHAIDHIIPKFGKVTRPGVRAIWGLHIADNFRCIPLGYNGSKWLAFTDEAAHEEEARLMQHLRRIGWAR